MRKLLLATALAAALTVPASASAEISAVFPDAAKPLACTVQASGQRFCGTKNGTTVPSWDGTPIDVSVALPPEPAEGADGNYPLVGIYHGWAGAKSAPSSSASSEYQRWLEQGYAVMSMTDRGFGKSCGTFLGIKPSQPGCGNGYLHLMHNAYEVRDAQHLMGLLADQGVIDGRRIGATGGSYGGGMSAQLGALRNRVQLPDGKLEPWTSPGGLPMEIAATAPEFGWTDIAQSLLPNGSSLDYAAAAPYSGPTGDRRVGVQKQAWNGLLYLGGSLVGYYAPPGLDPAADIRGWNDINDTGGPFDDRPEAAAMIEEMRNHGAYATDDSVAPAPALLSNGWNDDLFPVDEAVTYYNKVRSKHPSTPIRMYHLDFGHPNRAGTAPADAAAGLRVAENEWFARYVQGDGSTSTRDLGGVDIWTSSCPASAAVHQRAETWATLAPGEIRTTGGEPQTIGAPGSKSANPYTSGTVCTESAGDDNDSAATYRTAPAPAAGFTIAGSPTVVADLTVQGANDAVISRLYDLDPETGKQRLIARGIYRPSGVGQGPTKQVFQLHPQAYRIAPGHVVKLELLAQDSTYARIAVGQQDITVADLELRLPVLERPGDLGGVVRRPAAKELPAGYELARDFDVELPVVTITDGPSGDVPADTVSFAYASSKAGSSFECRLDGRPRSNCDDKTTLSGLTTGQHTFGVRAIDRYGRIGDEATRTFTVLLPAPPTTPEPPTGSPSDPPPAPPAPAPPAPAPKGERRVGVKRLTATVSVRSTARARRRPYSIRTTGRIGRPSSVPAKAACRGKVTVQVKDDRRTISSRRVRVRADCTFASSVTFKRQIRSSRLRVLTVFNGNARLAPRRASEGTVRIG